MLRPVIQNIHFSIVASRLKWHCKKHVVEVNSCVCTVSCDAIFFQCDFEYVRKGDELLHIFSHHIQKTEDQLWEILRTYMLQQWVQHISCIMLKDVKVSLEDYIDTITTPGVPIDFLAIVVLCRAYHFHLAVYTSKGVWATCRQKSINKCCIQHCLQWKFHFHGDCEEIQGHGLPGLVGQLFEGRQTVVSWKVLPAW